MIQNGFFQHLPAAKFPRAEGGGRVEEKWGEGVR